MRLHLLRNLGKFLTATGIAEELVDILQPHSGDHSFGQISFLRPDEYLQRLNRRFGRGLFVPETALRFIVSTTLMVSGVLKNALDLMGFDEFMGRVVGLIAVSGGELGGFGPLAGLRNVCRALHAWVVPEQALVPRAWDAFD